MKIKNTTLYLLLLSFLFMQSRCKDEKPEPPLQLPPITQEGKNTMGCLVNGEVYAVPIKTLNYEMQCEYYYRSFEPDLYGTFVISSSSGKYSDLKKTIVINMSREVFDTGYFALQYRKTGGKIRKALYSTFDGNKGIYFICPDSNSYGWMHISRLDTIAHIASGTFEFDAVNEDDNTDTIKIREGRFDAEYDY